jgi:hypothetical protein
MNENNGRGLTNVSKATLEDLRSKINQDELRTPITKAGLQAIGLSKLSESLSILEGLEKKSANALLDAVISERQNSSTPKLDLVWTGPESSNSTARDTWVVMHELFFKAQSNVLIAGFRFDDGKELFAPLYKKMVEHGLQVQIFLDIPRATSGATEDEFTKKYLQDFMVNNWPFGAPFPTFYYDPRTVTPDSLASLHAKCVVVDESITLIGSANFTDRGQTRNIELGVLIDDERFALEVVKQWRGLVGAMLLKSTH